MAPGDKLPCPGSITGFPRCDKDPKTAGTASPAELAAVVTAGRGHSCPEVPANPVTSARWGQCCRGEQGMLILAWLLLKLVL